MGLKFYLLAVFLFASAVFGKNPWPLPVVFETGSKSVSLDPKAFQFVISDQSNEILENGIERIRQIMFPAVLPIHPPFLITFSNNTLGETFNETAVMSIQFITIEVQRSSDELVLGVDESYNLTCDGNSIHLRAFTVWGALRGLQTFSQLVDWTGDENYVISTVPFVIQDYPRFPWRGLMIDSARHFLPLQTILTIIDGMENDKLNVLHWHLIDAESFPIESKTHPQLTKKGAWVYPYTIYTQDDVRTVIQYAKERGVRVVPEFDGPGHSFSWGKAYPNITINCPNLVASHQDYPWINVVPLDMRQDFTYQVVFDFLTEMSELFEDQYMHLGGDEVSSDCLDEDPTVKEWMEQQGMNTSTYDPLINYYESKVTDFIKSKKTPAFWQEVFEEAMSDSTVQLPNGTVVDVWVTNQARIDILREIVTNGYNAILSAGWYVDQQIPNPNNTFFLWIDTWKDFYLNEPLQGLEDLSSEEQNRVLGGEVCQWGEENDGHNIFSRIWPKASAAAERLWSPKEVTDAIAATPRLMEHRCRTLLRGVDASPIRPDYCPYVTKALPVIVVNNPVVTITKEFPVWIIVLEVILFSVAFAGIIGAYIWKMRRFGHTYSSIPVQ